MKATKKVHTHLSGTLAAPAAHAQNYTWNAATSGIWTADANWAGGIAPGTGNSTTNVTLNSASPLTSAITSTINTGNFTLNSLTFSSVSSGGTGNATNQLIFVDNGGTSPSIIFNSGNSSLAISVPISLGSSTTTFSGVVSGAGGAIVKNGIGAPTLTGNKTYTGNTTVNAGTLLVNNTAGSGTGSGAVSVAIGAILGGDGTIAGETTISGILAPGNSIGTLNITGNTSWQGAGVGGSDTDWKFELGASNAADRLAITGNFLEDVTLGSTFRFDFLAATEIGTFALVSWTGSTNFSVSYFSYTNLGGGNTGTFSYNGNQLEFSVVPESSTIYLLVMVGIGLSIHCIRRRRSF
jgi:autotransporter-associated beta strand protein